MSELKSFYVLLAPEGQLSGNGQLRETVSERRNRNGDNVEFWYLSPELVDQLKLSEKVAEAVVAEDPTVITWLKLRFGGESRVAELDIEKLREVATELPPAPSNRDIRNS